MNDPSPHGSDGLTVHVTIAPLPGCGPTGCTTPAGLPGTGVDPVLAIAGSALLLALGAAAVLRARRTPRAD
ncbi:hypothetical protein ACFOE1_11670 [Agromyces mediolanus]|uniref:Gram-positive cocci surface proteins LPxTG domain-containing protein n=1 Tax=Agromyces mediolanus TaxID=41986 RepID=A0A918F9P3_AGRME|nr:hypothetical protein [Agromyces mediolanus]GGR13764.1 hypothetical protein GCM10010196_02900 [Agromyces mediolanus]GLJ72694.1 hypothetical protein GCM10017583_19500 [Agromyces mediolanus]